MIVSITRQARGTLALSFPYDPALLAAVKSVPGRTWDRKSKVWSIPDTPENVLHLWRHLPKGAELRLPPSLQAELRARQDAIDTAKGIRDSGDYDTDFVFVTEPYAHQRAGLGFLQHLGSGALLWEMGTGKTKTAIDYCEWLYKDAELPFHVLVICPNSVTRNWLREIALHAGHDDASVPKGTLKDRVGQLGKNLYTIVNVESLSLEPLASAIVRWPWQVVIADESTRFKSPNVRRTKNFHKLTSVAHRIALTGTPITGKASDAWAQFEFVQPGLFGSWFHFQDTYLERDPWTKAIVGVRPGMEHDLEQRINARSYRILKADVLDLPPKVYVTRTVELAGDQKKAYDQMKKDLMVEIGLMKRLTAPTILTQLLRLTQITAGILGQGTDYRWFDDGAKVKELDALLDELAGEQVVIVGIYQRELEELAKRYTTPWPATSEPWPIIYGPTPPQVRDDLIQEFQAGRRRLLFVQSRTGGIGINLTAAQTVIFYTRGWSLEEYLQTQDRLHRIGQTGTVSVLHLVAAGTVDEDIAKALSDKQELADQLTGDKARRLASSVLGGNISGTD